MKDAKTVTKWSQAITYELQLARALNTAVKERQGKVRKYWALYANTVDPNDMQHVLHSVALAVYNGELVEWESLE